MQKARLARIQIAKATSGAAFVAKKRAAEARLAAQEAGIQLDDDVNENIFELQHHHLLRCLEKTTVKSIQISLKSNFVVKCARLIPFNLQNRIFTFCQKNKDKVEGLDIFPLGH